MTQEHLPEPISTPFDDDHKKQGAQRADKVAQVEKHLVFRQLFDDLDAAWLHLYTCHPDFEVESERNEWIDRFMGVGRALKSIDWINRIKDWAKTQGKAANAACDMLEHATEGSRSHVVHDFENFIVKQSGYCTLHLFLPGAAVDDPDDLTLVYSIILTTIPIHLNLTFTRSEPEHTLITRSRSAIQGLRSLADTLSMTPEKLENERRVSGRPFELSVDGYCFIPDWRKYKALVLSASSCIDPIRLPAQAQNEGELQAAYTVIEQACRDHAGLIEWDYLHIMASINGHRSPTTVRIGEARECDTTQVDKAIPVSTSDQATMVSELPETPEQPSKEDAPLTTTPTMPDGSNNSAVSGTPKRVGGRPHEMFSKLIYPRIIELRQPSKDGKTIKWTKVCRMINEEFGTDYESGNLQSQVSVLRKNKANRSQSSPSKKKRLP